MTKETMELHDEAKDWRLLFPHDLLNTAAQMVNKGVVVFFQAGVNKATAIIRNKNGQEFDVVMSCPKSYEEEWEDSMLYCSCLTKRSFSFLRGGKVVSVRVCQHQAAALYEWEKRHGSWFFPEPHEAKLLREQQERAAREAAERDRKQRQEAERLMAEKAAKQKIIMPAENFFPGEDPADSFFSVKRVVQGMTTDQYCVEQARRLLEAEAGEMEKPRLTYGIGGEQTLCASAMVNDAPRRIEADVFLDAERMSLHRCYCNARYMYNYIGSSHLCQHQLLLLTLLREYILENNPGDGTDRAASAFFEAMDRFSMTPDEHGDSDLVIRPREIRLSPWLQLNGDSAELSYKIGLLGAKPVFLRSYREFIQSVEKREVFNVTKKVTLDFSAMDLTEDSLPWLTFLQRRISETDVANDSISQGYYYSKTLKVKTRDTLIGAMLDRFYELAEGSQVEYSSDGETGSLRVGHSRLRIALRAQRVPLSGKLRYVEVTGEMPLILPGSAGNYFLWPKGLSKLTKEEEKALRPLRSALDEAGNIFFRVGMDSLAEFYYRVVPQLMDSPYVDFEDTCAHEIESLLPPEPHFRFLLDLDELRKQITCRTLVRYGESAEKSLPYPRVLGEYRDAAQEDRVLRTLAHFFPGHDAEKALRWHPLSEASLYSVLTEALPELERFGPVEGSSAIARSKPRPMPQLRVGVSVESGLLEIELLTRDISPEELLGVLESYRQKKQYHRLQSGAFVSLSQDSQLSELEAISQSVDFSLEDAIRGGAKVPMYRALYLNSLLEEHDDLASNRDRTYRSLLKNFKTIRDADYEVPEAQAEVLRPYQVYGYKWLHTLASAGFGGILADEMGLGKTLQFISLVQSLRDSGEMDLCLVVCPASLVYNWQEEFQRFAPGIETLVLSGPSAVRKKRLASLPSGAVCITSYDLLRQDIAEYRALEFSLMVLDEAQYIKNQKASMTKAVKAVRSKIRFALTGTPIENRLAELWSIFDFLMPGFLYTYPEFSRQLETPITKQKDPAATAKLKAMSSPFILRRLKADVLKDLPPKLEEVRYTRFGDEQRKIYDGQVVRMKQLVLSGDTSGEAKVRLFAELTRVRQICCDPSLLLEDYHKGSAKREACLELIQNAMTGGHRMLVFSQFTSMLSLLEEDLKREGIDYKILTGATPKEQRLKMVRDFNEGDTPVFLISLKAGGTGLNLTGADVVIHYDPWWNLAAQNQATDRAHRIGQQNQVTVYRIIVKDTIEEKILALQEAKRDLAEAVLSGESKSLAALSNEELLDLLG